MQSTPPPEKTTAKKTKKTKQKKKQKRKTEKNKVYHWKFPKFVNPHGWTASRGELRDGAWSIILLNSLTTADFLICKLTSIILRQFLPVGLTVSVKPKCPVTQWKLKR